MESSIHKDYGGREVSRRTDHPDGHLTHRRTLCIIPHPSQNCKSWRKAPFESISTDPCECPACAAVGRVLHLKTRWRWMLDVEELPEHFSLERIEEVKIQPVRVPTYLVRCEACHTVLHLVPSFMRPGTRLTLAVLVLVAFLYEATDRTWRGLAETLGDNSRVAHSTLFKGVRGLGRSMCAEDVLRQLTAAGLLQEDVGWRSAKSRLPHTIEEEAAARKLLDSLRRSELRGDFYPALSRLLDRLHRLFVKFGVGVHRLYPRRNL